MRAILLLLFLVGLQAPALAQSVKLHSGKTPEGWTNGLLHSDATREACLLLLFAVPNDIPGREYIRCITSRVPHHQKGSSDVALAQEPKKEDPR